MKCPYCNEDMAKGYIQCRDGVNWTDEKTIIAALSAWEKEEPQLANGGAENKPNL